MCQTCRSGVAVFRLHVVTCLAMKPQVHVQSRRLEGQQVGMGGGEGRGGGFKRGVAWWCETEDRQ